MTTMRPLPASDQERIHVFDKEYRCDRLGQARPLRPIITHLKGTTHCTSNRPKYKRLRRAITITTTTEDINGSTTKPIFLDDFHVSLSSIKEYMIKKDGNTYIPLHSRIPLKKRRQMLYLLLEIGEITMDGLVDSEAFINSMSWSDYNAIKMNSDNCIMKEYPQPPFKIECANAQLEQPIATADMQFNIGTYTFTETFVILSKTSFPIIGLIFMRNRQLVLDTANGTINFPHVEMTLAMTDEMKNCKLKQLQIMADRNLTLLPH